MTSGAAGMEQEKHVQQQQQQQPLDGDFPWFEADPADIRVG